ncbi:phosphoribosyl transferase-like protein [Cricetibacter osteomyelitidis]|uniref:Phosphoribosyl transferase-like protein n=1 Tax=Cricetibacter osteomyelitidis TaxID=1521931 RepID=A0A4R2T1G9_9PAST|nr:phosphoribosyltransferase family protein [Cricetibacter osteomyelitidis]TCP95191.1 phosphoribosyl transferase-like protein [Cricetibacter osteomyelitidis]
MSIEIQGSWHIGFAYDYHMKSSIFLGYDVYGNPLFENIRTEMGELVYQLKYNQNPNNVSKIVDLLVDAFSGWESMDMLITAPFSNHREYQPVMLIGDELSKRVNLPCHHVLKKIKNKTSLKNLSSIEDKKQALTGNIILDSHDLTLKNKTILLIDDLYSSGSTLEYSTNVLLQNGAKEVNVLVMTKTKG